MKTPIKETPETIRRHRLAEQWLAENREAIEAYNEYFAKQTFSDGLRRF